MPQKRNPVKCGAIKALAVKLRFNAGALAELPARDLRDMSCFVMEDLVLSEASLLMDALLKTSHTVLSGLVVRPENMRRNLDAEGGALMAEALALSFSLKTGRKESAMRFMRQAAQEAHKAGVPFARQVMELPELRSCMSGEEIREALNPARYRGLSDALIDDVLHGMPEE